MVLKNVSNKAVNVKLDDSTWVTVGAGETVDLPVRYVREGLESTVDKALDLNNDGVVDKKDRSLAAKALRKGSKKKVKKSKK